MISISDSARSALNAKAPQHFVVVCVLTDGTTYTYDDEIMMGENNIVDSFGSGSFPIGCVCSKTISLTIDNRNGQYNGKEFNKAKLTASIKWTDGTNTYTIQKGTFTVTDPVAVGDTIELTGQDDIYRTDVTYTKGSLTFPVAEEDMFQWVCGQCNLTSSGTTSMGYTFHEEPEDGTTLRQILEEIALMEKGNIRLDTNGDVSIIRWDFSQVTTDGITATDPVAVKGQEHIFSQFSTTPTISSSDIIITGIDCSDGETTYSFGSDGYKLSVSVQSYDSLNAEDIGQNIYSQLGGHAFRTLTGDIYTNPTVEAGDMAVTVDRFGGVHVTPVTEVTYNLLGVTSVATTADAPVYTTTSYASAQTQAIQSAKKLIARETTERETAVADLTQKIADSMGLHATIVPDGEGGYIYYLYDKETLEKSKIVWKMTADAWAVSSDGGKTWNAGVTINGDVIANILNSTGINADWINTGELVVKNENGDVIFLLDTKTGQFFSDSESVQIGCSTNNYELVTDDAFIVYMTRKSIALDSEFYPSQKDYYELDSDDTYFKYNDARSPESVIISYNAMWGGTDVSDAIDVDVTYTDNIAITVNKTARTIIIDDITGGAEATITVKAILARRYYAIATYTVEPRAYDADNNYSYIINASMIANKYVGELIYPTGHWDDAYSIDDDMTAGNTIIIDEDGYTDPQMIMYKALRSNATTYDTSNGTLTLYDGGGTAVYSTTDMNFGVINCEFITDGSGNAIVYDSGWDSEKGESTTEDLVGFGIITDPVNGLRNYTIKHTAPNTMTLLAETSPTVANGGEFGYNDVFNIVTADGTLNGIYKEYNGFYGLFKMIKALKIVPTEVFELVNSYGNDTTTYLKWTQTTGLTINAGCDQGAVSIRFKNNKIVVSPLETDGSEPEPQYILSMDGDGLKITSETTSKYTDPNITVGVGTTSFKISGDGITAKGMVTVENFATTGSKSRVAHTEHYGDRLLYAYENPTPYFGDIGTAQTDTTCTSRIDIDQIFSETITGEYVVFLQAEGDGQVWISHKAKTYFIVSSNRTSVKFAWELKAKQKGYETTRLERVKV